MSAVVAGIDSSTQSCTVVLRDLDTGETVAVQSSRHPRTTPPVSEQDPASWWTALGQALTEARQAVPDAPIAALSVDAQAHGLVPVDAAGTVIRPAKLWNDTTSAAEARELVDRLGRHEWVRRTGSVPPAAFTISKVLWLARHEREHFDQLRQLLLPHDWLTYQLTGEYLTDPSDASGTGYYNPATGEWDPALLGLIDPDVDWAARLPRLLRHDEPAGTLTGAAAASLGLDVGTLVGPGAADNQAAAVGMGVRAGDIVVSLGTSGVVYTRSELAVHDPSGAVNGNADATGHFLPVVCTLNAAKVTDTFTRLLGVDHDQLTQLALARSGRSTPTDRCWPRSSTANGSPTDRMRAAPSPDYAPTPPANRSPGPPTKACSPDSSAAWRPSPTSACPPPAASSSPAAAPDQPPTVSCSPT